MTTSTDPAIEGPVERREPMLLRLGHGLTTTPGRMRVAMVAIVVCLILMAVVGSAALRARNRATDAVGLQAEPLLVGAGAVYTSLADADATATNTFLTPGLEPPARRQAYLDDLATAARQLASVGRRAGASNDVAQALSVIARDLPLYSGLVEAARANNRLGYPVGAAYLREGSTLMQREILPAVRELYRVEAGRLERSYRAGRSAVDVMGIVLVAGVAVPVLVLGQVFMARRTNRVLNPGLVTATAVVLVALTWTAAAFSASAGRLGQARTEGSDPVQLFSSARILVARAQADDSLYLVSRGGAPQYVADFQAVEGALGSGPGALLLTAGKVAPPSIPDASYRAFAAAHALLVNDATGGEFARAVGVATGGGIGDELPAAAALSATLDDRIGQAQAMFDAKAAAARHDLSLLSLVLVGLAVLAAGLAIAGVEQRVNDYR